MKQAVALLLFAKLSLAEPLNALPAHPPVENPRLRPDDMGSFHDPRGHCYWKTLRLRSRNKTKRIKRMVCSGRLHQGIDVINLPLSSEHGPADKRLQMAPHANFLPLSSEHGSAGNPALKQNASESLSMRGRISGPSVVISEPSVIYAIRGGKIVWRGNHYGLGFIIVVEHEDHYYIIYAHLDKSVYKLRTGQAVERGQIIGKMGASGNAHHSPYPYQVHIEVIKAPYFRYRGAETFKWLKRLGEKTYNSPSSLLKIRGEGYPLPFPPEATARLCGGSAFGGNLRGRTTDFSPYVRRGREGLPGGLVPPHKLESLRSVIPGLADFRDCPKFQMHCTCPEVHGEYCHEFDKNIRCP